MATEPSMKKAKFITPPTIEDIYEQLLYSSDVGKPSSFGVGFGGEKKQGLSKLPDFLTSTTLVEAFPDICADCWYIHSTVFFRKKGKGFLLTCSRFFYSEDEYLHFTKQVKDFFDSSDVYEEYCIQSTKTVLGSIPGDIYSMYALQTKTEKKIPKDALYLNGKNANKDKLNSYLHTVGKHYVNS